MVDLWQAVPAAESPQLRLAGHRFAAQKSKGHGAPAAPCAGATAEALEMLKLVMLHLDSLGHSWSQLVTWIPIIGFWWPQLLHQQLTGEDWDQWLDHRWPFYGPCLSRVDSHASRSSFMGKSRVRRFASLTSWLFAFTEAA